MHGYRKWFPALFVLSGLIVSALTCGGAITTIHNTHNNSGHIEVRFSAEDGEVAHDILLDKSWASVRLHCDVKLEMEEGSFTAVLVDGKGARFPLKASSGEPASLSLDLVTDLSGEIRIEGEGRKARGILLTIDYAGNDLPRRWDNPDFD